MYTLHAPTPPKPIIRTPIHHPPNPHLPHHRRAHNARLHRHVQRHPLERRRPLPPGPARGGDERGGLLGRRVDVGGSEGPGRGVVGEGAGGEEVAEGVELGVEGCVARVVGPVPAAGDDGAVLDEDAADGDLGVGERFFGLRTKSARKAVSVLAGGERMWDAVLTIRTAWSMKARSSSDWSLRSTMMLATPTGFWAILNELECQRRWRSRTSCCRPLPSRSCCRAGDLSEPSELRARPGQDSLRAQE